MKPPTPINKYFSIFSENYPHKIRIGSGGCNFIASVFKKNYIDLLLALKGVLKVQPIFLAI
jgi:hypothetical protein